MGESGATADLVKWVAQTDGSDLEQATLDYLIDALPPVECEEWRDPFSREFLVDPVVTELGVRIKRGDRLSDAQWRRALEKSRAIRIRNRWPVGVPLAVGMECPRWLGLAEIRMQPLDPALRAASAGALNSGGSGTYLFEVRIAQRCQEIGSVPPGESVLAFNVEVEQGRSREQIMQGVPREGRVLWSGEIEFRVTTCTEPDEAVPAVSGGAWDEAVRDAISIAFLESRIAGQTRRSAVVLIDPDTARYPALQNVALSLSVELLHGGLVAENHHLQATRCDVLPTPPSFNPGQCRAFAAASFVNLPLDAERSEESRRDWTLRVRGTREGVLHQLDADQVYIGTLEFPIGEAIEREIDRVGGGSRQPWLRR